MEMHRCKLCFTAFSNGRALGGHMRAHFMKGHQPQGDECEDGLMKQPSEADQELSDVVQDGGGGGGSESETESSKSIPLCRRSKRVIRKSRIWHSSPTPPPPSRVKKSTCHDQHSPLSSSVSDHTRDKDVAYCLMMLSRDERSIEMKNDDSFEVIQSSNSSKVTGKYTCETCCRSFRSYQALGGHMASHKKNRVDPPPPGAPAAEEKIHECPLCHRVFASGQALGGHKRSHFVGSSNLTTHHKRKSRNDENLDIDLKLPAPIHDGDVSH